MSVDYAAGLSHYDDLGVCGLEEIPETIGSVKEKVDTLANWFRQYKGSCIAHVGAGLSTAAGIPDFRGESGVWTKLLHGSRQHDSSSRALTTSLNTERLTIKTDPDNGAKPTIKPFDETKPTKSHMIMKELCRLEYISHIISQNVDGLFLKANLERRFISELHGNFYLDECTACRNRYIRATASSTMRLTKSPNRCPRIGKPCKGYLRDTILDWESPIPYNELRVAERESKRNKLHMCIGTSMQLKPSKDLVFHSKRNKSYKLVIINLQPTQFDSMADLVIHYYADDVMSMLADSLNLTNYDYDLEEDPTKRHDLIGTAWKRK